MKFCDFLINYEGQRGFTLVELLLYVGISTIILSSLLVFSVYSEFSRVKGETVLEVDQQGIFLMNYILTSIRNSESITSPLAGSSLSTLTLDVYGSEDDPTVFSVDGGILEVIEGVSDSVALSTSRVSVSDLEFSNVSKASTSGIIRVQFTISHDNPSGRSEYDYSKTFVGSASLNHP